MYRQKINPQVKSKKITITSSSGLSDQEIKNMINDAEKHESNDKTKLDLIEEKNKLDNTIYNIEKMIKENKGKINAKDIKDTEVSVKKARLILNSKNIEEIKSALAELTKFSHTLAEQMYKQTNNDKKGDTKINDKPKDKNSKNIVDAEFEDNNKS